MPTYAATFTIPFISTVVLPYVATNSKAFDTSFHSANMSAFCASNIASIGSTVLPADF